MVTLGLDVSTVAVGWALWKDEVGIEGTGMIEFDKKSSLPSKLRYANSYFQHLYETLKPDKVVMEDSYFSFNIKTLKVLCMVQGAVLSSWNGENVILVNASRARKQFGIEGKGKGQGRMKREEVKKVVKEKIKEKFGIEIQNDDIADAIVLACYKE